MRNDDYYMELNESIVLMDKRTEGPGDARFHFHEDYEIFLFLEGDVDLYIEQSVHHMQRGHLAVFNDREIHRACHYGKIPFHRIVHSGHESSGLLPEPPARKRQRHPAFRGTDGDAALHE